MAAVIKQQPEITDQLAQVLLTKFELDPKFIKEIVNKALTIVRKTANYNFQQRFKESGILGIATDAAKSIFQKPKQQQPLVQDTLDKTKPASTGLTSTSIESKEPLIQQNLPFTVPEQTEEKQLIEKKEKPKEILIAGITEEGVKNLKDKLPDLFKEVFKKLPKEEQKTPDTKSRFSEKGLLGMLPPGLLAMGGGLALLLGGLAALVTGLQTDGPLKGLLKIFSKVGLQGGIKLLEKGAKTFLKTLTSVIKAPVGLLRSVARSIGSIFGPGVYKKVLTGIKAAKGLFANMLKGLIKVISPLLKRIPLIGTIISFGFAYTRFKSGDVMGGIIDILSGVATIFPGVGTAISIGLDVLNAFLDFKTGGATTETSLKKTGVLKGWIKGIGGWFKKNGENLPLIGPLIKTGRLISESKWAEAISSVVEWIPGLSWVLDWLGFTAEKRTEIAQGNLNKVSDAVSSFMTWINESVWGTISNFFTGIFDSVKSYWDNLSLDPRSWVGMAPKAPTPNKIDVLGTEEETKKPELAEGGVAVEPTEALVGEDGPEAVVPLAKGGVVTQPTTALVGEAGKEAVIPLEKYFNGKDFSLSNNTLDKIASNTGSTNEVLKMLGQAIFKLAQAYETKSKNSNNIVINGQQQSPTPSASQVAATNVDPIRRIRAQFGAQFAT
jgi:hypothetical protein